MNVPRRCAHAGRALSALLTLALVLGGPFAGVASAAAAPGSDLIPVHAPLRFEAGRYVVVLKSPPATAYAGNAGRRTGPSPHGRFDGRSPAVQRYSAHLRRTHRAVAQAVGARVARDYTVALNGFAARLSSSQAGELAGDQRVLMLAPDRRLRVDTAVPTARSTDGDTTRAIRGRARTADTAGFLGLTGARGAWARHGGRAHAGAGTVVGVIDSGIWPESASFAGRPLTSRPVGAWGYQRVGHRTFMRKADGGRFAGVCQTGEQFTLADCSTKLIGARFYPPILSEVPHPSPHEYLSPRDGDGHGTRTAGVAAGRSGVPATVEGRDFGRISGMAPGARIAAYKVCLSDTRPESGDCFTSASLAAIDDAVRDGVDVISYSISGAVGTVLDPVELAFEGAAEAGIFVATSAGNSGPEPGTVEHPAPWVTTVAASTYTSFENTVLLGDGTEVVGASIADTPVPRSPLVSSSTVAADGVPVEDATLCAPRSLDRRKVAGTIVVCSRGTYDRVAKSAEVARAGGVGMVLANPSDNTLDADFHAVPTVHVDAAAAKTVLSYVRRAGDRATAAILLGNRTSHWTPVPQVGGFSSRGPSPADGADVLKPDLAAPGLGVLAPAAPPSDSGREFDVSSGSSMAAPHVAGLAAFLASRKPDWSPMRIKSALMTTSGDVVEADGKRSSDLFAQGAGSVRPDRAFDPGLVVAATPKGWRGYLDAHGLADGAQPVTERSLNLPSMTEGEVAAAVSFRRRFVSTRRGAWTVSVDVPGFAASTSRPRLVARRPGAVRDLTVRFTRTTAPLGQFSEGYVTLRGPTRVRVPVALRPVAVGAQQDVTARSADGTARITGTAGFTGDLDVKVTGLARAASASGTVAAGADDLYCVTTSDTTRALRVDLDAGEGAGGLDLAGFRLRGGCASDAVDHLVTSGGPAADRSFTLLDPAPGSYLLQVGGPADGGEKRTGYRLDVFDVDDSTAVGGLRAEPNPVPVLTGRPVTFRVRWAGLDPGSRYLGVLEYAGAPTPTYVTVDTGKP